MMTETLGSDAFSLSSALPLFLLLFSDQMSINAPITVTCVFSFSGQCWDMQSIKNVARIDLGVDPLF